MFGKIYITGIKQTQNQRNSNAKYSSNKNTSQVAPQAELGKTKCAGGVCSLDWKPIPTFYGSNRS